MRRADNFTTFMCRVSWNLGAWTSWNPHGLSRPVIWFALPFTFLPYKSSVSTGKNKWLMFFLVGDGNCYWLPYCIITAVNSSQIEPIYFHFNQFFDAFGKLRVAIISFVMTVSLSIFPHGTTLLPLDGFSWNLKFEHFSKMFPWNSSLMKIWEECRLFYTEYLW